MSFSRRAICAQENAQVLHGQNREGKLAGLQGKGTWPEGQRSPHPAGPLPPPGAPGSHTAPRTPPCKPGLQSRGLSLELVPGPAGRGQLGTRGLE